ncbi:MAG: hypothetical protein R3324_06860 [Halobacteriales archaeon]|nr:hypothetical protein [Halobacteriales archaeon]
MPERTPKKYRLRNLHVDRTDLVARGANQEAHIVLVKSDDTPTPDWAKAAAQEVLKRMDGKPNGNLSSKKRKAEDDEEEEKKKRKRALVEGQEMVEKHNGPGPHESGTTQQEAHGEGREGQKSRSSGSSKTSSKTKATSSPKADTDAEADTDIAASPDTPEDWTDFDEQWFQEELGTANAALEDGFPGFHKTKDSPYARARYELNGNFGDYLGRQAIVWDHGGEWEYSGANETGRETNGYAPTKAAALARLRRVVPLPDEQHHRELWQLRSLDDRVDYRQRWAKAVGKLPARDRVSKHMGPGPHKSGSDQSVHGGDGTPADEFGSPDAALRSFLDRRGHDVWDNPQGLRAVADNIERDGHRSKAKALRARASRLEGGSIPRGATLTRTPEEQERLRRRAVRRIEEVRDNRTDYESFLDALARGPFGKPPTNDPNKRPSNRR